MEHADHFSKLLPHVRCSDTERAWLERQLRRIDPESTDRAAFQLLHIQTVQERAPEIHDLARRFLVEELGANMFTRVRLRTTMILLALLGSHWAPDEDLRGSVKRLLQDSMRRHERSPVYQVFVRAIDHSWNELLTTGVKMVEFAGDMRVGLEVHDVTDGSASVTASGPDSLFAVLVLPGFIQGMMRMLSVTGEVTIAEEREGAVELEVVWRAD